MPILSLKWLLERRINAEKRKEEDGMKLTKKVLALCLSLLLVLPMSLPALAEGEEQDQEQTGEVQGPTQEEPTDEEILAASRTALQVAVNRGINDAAYEEASTAAFDEALAAAEALLEQEDPAVTAEQFDAALEAMNAAKEELVYVENVVGAFAADNTDEDTSSATTPWPEIQMDWTTADKTPIDLSESDKTKVTVSFDLTLTNTSGSVADADVFKNASIVLRSVDENGTEHKAQYNIPAGALKAGLNEISVTLNQFNDEGVDWANLTQMRFFIPGVSTLDVGKAGWFTLQLADIRITDETPDDYQPIEGVVAEFYDGETHANETGRKDLASEWVSTTPVDISDKPLDQMYLQVNFTLTNTTGQADSAIFNAGYFRLRSTDDEGSTPPDGENNVGYSLKDLMDRGLIQQPVVGENTVEFPLSAYNTELGDMKWDEVNRFRMYFDNLPDGLENGSVTLTVNSAVIIDRAEEVDPTVVGKFSNAAGTYTATNDGAGSNVVLQTNGWVEADAAMDLSEVNMDETVLRITMTLDNKTTAEDAVVFRTGKILLSSPSTGEGETAQENSVRLMIADLIDVHEVALTAGRELTLNIPLSWFATEAGEIDWSNVTRFRIFIDSVNQHNGTTTMDIASVEVIDPSRTDPDPLPDVGNVDGQGDITANDALMALQIATNKIEATTEQVTQADVNKDGNVSANDALQILQYATQKITSFSTATEA